MWVQSVGSDGCQISVLAFSYPLEGLRGTSSLRCCRRSTVQELIHFCVYHERVGFNRHFSRFTKMNFKVKSWLELLAGLSVFLWLL